MNIFGWRKNLAISEQNPTFKVRYLGNVQTSVMKGEGCADRATNIIWSNHQRNDQQGMDMKIELTGSGMKAHTQDQGLTEYLASRISYCIAHPNYPRLFVWVYRHEGRKNKMELRCHAVLCKSDAKAKAIALQLSEKLKNALGDFKREKLHLQNSRLALQKTNHLPKSGSILPLRTQLLSTAKNFRPPPTRSNSGSKLGAILEDKEAYLEECAEDEEEEEEGYTEKNQNRAGNHTKLKGRILNSTTKTTSVSRGVGNSDLGDLRDQEPPSPSASAGPLSTALIHRGKEHHGILEALDLETSADNFPENEDEGEMFGADDVIDLEFGNDLNALEQDGAVQYCLNENAVDSDEESAESGFHDQEANFPDSESTTEVLRTDSSSSSSSSDDKKMSREKVKVKLNNGNGSKESNEEQNREAAGAESKEGSVKDSEIVCALPCPEARDVEEETAGSDTVEVTAL